MYTEICKKLGIEYPIFAFTHCRDVVVAVSKAGGIGVLGAVGFSPEELKAWRALMTPIYAAQPPAVQARIKQIQALKK